MINKITIPYVPRRWAIPFHETNKRWMVLVVHRRAGKTTAALNFLIHSALTTRGTNYAYIAPTYKMAKNTAWEILKKYVKPIPGVMCRESELSIIFPNGSRITLYGSENPDRLRGIGLSGVVFDEYGMQPTNIFTEVIRPALIEKEGYSIWIGTPQGKNEFYRLFEGHKNDDDWFIRHLTVDDTKVLKKEELEDAKKEMSPEESAQELYCSFDSALKGAVYAQEINIARQQGRIMILPFQRDQKVYTVWDIGVGQAMAIGFYQRIRGLMYMIDFWQGNDNDGIDQAVIAVQRKPYTYGKHFAPHDINTRETSTGKSRIDYAKDLGLSFEVISPNNVEDGIQNGRFMFDRLWIDEEKCSLWLDAIGQYKREWDDRRGMFKEVPYHNWTSHAADVHRYAAIIEKKMEDTSNDYYDPFMYEEEENFDPYW